MRAAAWDDAVRKAGILHRDISAGNILLCGEGDAVCGKLSDWDLCSRLNDASVDRRKT
jgi:serine/threonine protein kinase